MIRAFQVLALALLAPLTLLSGEDTEQLDFKINSYTRPQIITTFQGFSATDSEARLILSDGSIWLVRNLPASQVAEEIASEWCLGDDIRLDKRIPKKYRGHFLLKNARTTAVYLVDLDPQCADFSRASIIDKIDQNGYAIWMNGGTEWSIGYFGSFTTSNWRPYDRVIINKSSYSRAEDYLIINADDASSAWSSLIVWK